VRALPPSSTPARPSPNAYARQRGELDSASSNERRKATRPRRGKGGPSDPANEFSKWLFRISVVFAFFVAGMYWAAKQVFPADLVHGWTTTAARILDARLGGRLDAGRWEFADVPADSVANARVRTTQGAPLVDPVLSVGGMWQFREHCPRADGCLAVEHRGSGQVVRAWPFAIDDLANAEPIAALPFERTPGVQAGDVLVVDHVAMFSDGDLLATFRRRDHFFPSGGGIARIDETGRVLWYRRDYSHGEPHVGPGDTIWAPSQRLADESFRLRPQPMSHKLCDQGPVQLAVVNVLDGDGRLVREMSVVDAMLDSPWAAHVVTRPDACNPLHVNSASLVGAAVSGLVDANPGDVVVSIGNRGAFAVLDRHSDRVLLYVQGTFSRQHSVKHLRGSEFIMFDNLGVWKSSDGTPMAYSRVLVVDAATGREKTVFPTEPRRFGPWKQYDHGRVSVSSDGLRALASYSRHAKAVEVRIEDGAVLAEFEALHDVRALPVFAGGNGVVRFLDSGGFLYAGGQAQAGAAAGRQGR